MSGNAAYWLTFFARVAMGRRRARPRVHVRLIVPGTYLSIGGRT